jgi:hypothetical protein
VIVPICRRVIVIAILTYKRNECNNLTKACPRTGAGVGVSLVIRPADFNLIVGGDLGGDIWDWYQYSDHA